eukprot:TRINITY_DN14158_c0_g1_i4.p1 TRINITY_DN14158_c0_g1~~TRINITY_DN14158_c0_g1_i4.p1  ORF type:complete len:920 (+),score=312.33 TRINITY_DN14158_c0_g1_i4:601-3360(+)
MHLVNKPITMVPPKQYLTLLKAQKDKLLTVTIDVPEDRMEQITTMLTQKYLSTDTDMLAEAWNEVRTRIIKKTISLLFKDLHKELLGQLQRRASEYVVAKYSAALDNLLRQRGYVNEKRLSTPGMDPNPRSIVLSITPPDQGERDQPCFACIVDRDRELVDHMTLAYLHRRPRNDTERTHQESEFHALAELYRRHEPDVVVIGTSSTMARYVMSTMERLLDQLPNAREMTLLTYGSEDVPRIFESCSRAELQFPDHPIELRRAVSLARYTQDPLLEITQLWDDPRKPSLGRLRVFDMQRLVPTGDLMKAAQEVLCRYVNTIGVNINQALLFESVDSIVQFTAGLGPRKAQTLMNSIRREFTQLQNRLSLSKLLGPTVLTNCSGFIQVMAIDRYSYEDDEDEYKKVHLLDRTRIHPESYEIAYKLCQDLIEEEGVDKETAVLRVMENPHLLDEVMFETFAQDLENLGRGKKLVTLREMDSELRRPFREQRNPFERPDEPTVFTWMTGETADTLFPGQEVDVRITRLNPPYRIMCQLTSCGLTGFINIRNFSRSITVGQIMNEDIRSWPVERVLQRFSELNMDAARENVELNQVNGAMLLAMDEREIRRTLKIPPGAAMDHLLKDIKELKAQQILFDSVGKVHRARIQGPVVYEKFLVELTTRSDHVNNTTMWRRPGEPDEYNSPHLAVNPKEQEKLAAKAKRRAEAKRMNKRDIDHPYFQNVNAHEAETLLENKADGEFVIRPSSQKNRLTVSMKLFHDVVFHLKIVEHNRGPLDVIGNKLTIDGVKNGEEYEELDELIDMYVIPFIDYYKDMTKFDKFVDMPDRPSYEKHLKQKLASRAGVVHYCVGASRKYPGKFELWCLMTTGRMTKEIINCSDQGYRFWGKTFTRPRDVIHYFKSTANTRGTHQKSVRGFSKATPR